MGKWFSHYLSGEAGHLNVGRYTSAMLRSEFNFELPTELIAQSPLAERTQSRLLQLDAERSSVVDGRFSDLLELLQPNDLMVMNNTRVIPARLLGQKESGGKVEVLLERILDSHRILAQVRASKSPRAGTRLLFDGFVVEMLGRHDDFFELRFDSAQTALEVLEQIGHMPLPPYIEREDRPADRERYQTVFAQEPGAVAAPTAGLHFDQAMLDKLAEKGVETAWVTLHVGAGTFQPMRSATVEGHQMHSERIEVPAEVCAQIEATQARGGRVIAIGTTSVRCLESAFKNGKIAPISGETDIFIYPGYEFQVVDALVTNFHLPESTLLMLVSAFAGYEEVMAAYRHAVDKKYRFFSYGDAMWLTKKQKKDAASEGCV